MPKKIYPGGQAVIEGVLMRTKNKIAVAVRKPNGKIIVKAQKFNSWTKRSFLKLPFIRGIVTLFEMLYIGMKELTWSANQSVGQEDEDISKFEIIATIFVSIIFALLLFKLLPLGIANLVGKNANNFLFNLIDGVSKVVILVLYIWAISLMKDVRRLFQYHAAEHMAVHCYEAKKKLTVTNIKKYNKEHPRCGTSFILFVLIISILFYLLIPLSASFWTKYGLRILLLPLIAGVSYELLVLAGKHQNNKFFTALSYPGHLLQKITTVKPEDEMIKVAIKALKAVVS